RNFWNKHRKQRTGRVRWSLLEDCILYLGQQYFTNKWSEIAFYLPGRTSRQVQNRYMTAFSTENRKLGCWTHKEDSRLLKLRAELSKCKWNIIANQFEGRTIKQLRSRYRILKRRMKDQ